MTWRLRDPTGFVFDIAGMDELELLPNLLRPGTTSVFDFGDPAHVIQTVFVEEVRVYDVGGVNLSTILMNGVDMEFTNATLLGDMAFATTTEMRFSVAGGQELSINTNAILVTLGSQLRFADATRYIVDNGANLDIINTGGVINIDASATVTIDGATGVNIVDGGVSMLALTSGQLQFRIGGGNRLSIAGTLATFTADILPSTTSTYDFGTAALVWQKAFLEEIGLYDVGGVNNSTFVMNGVDLEITNTTALGDMIFNSTVEIRQEINSVVRTILGTSFFTIQRPGTPQYVNLNTYSTINADTSNIYLQKSHTNTLGVLTPTIAGDVFGIVAWAGVNNISALDRSALITVTQVGGAGAQLAATLKIETYDTTGINLNQLILRSDGSIRMGATATYMVTEADADTYWVGDGTGLPYGMAYDPGLAWTQANAVQNTWYNVVDAAINSGELNEVTHDGNGELTVLKAGRYAIDWAICIDGSVANDNYEVGIEIDGSGSAIEPGQNHYNGMNANADIGISGCAIVDLAAGATVEVAVRTTDANTPDITVHFFNLRVVHIGGT